MTRTITRVMATALCGAIIFAGIMLLGSADFLAIVQAESQSIWPSASRATAALRDALIKPLLAGDAGNKPAESGDLINVSKQEVTEKGSVVDHSYGGIEHVYEQRYVTNQYLTIVSRTDSIAIEGVTGNRGNCPINVGFFPQKYPIQLKFGETARLNIVCETLIEVEVKTSAGTVSFNWNQ